MRQSVRRVRTAARTIGLLLLAGTLGLAAMPGRVTAAAPADEAPPAGGPAVAAKEMSVKLIDAGEGDKSPLRYKFEKGKRETLTADADVSMKIVAAGQQLPPMTLPTVRVNMKSMTDEVLADGSARVTIEVVGGDVIAKGADGGGPAAAAMKAEMAKMSGIKGHLLLTSRGETTEVQFDVPADADAQVKQKLKSFEQTMKQVSVPLPVEAVGRGARWQAVMTAEVNNIKVTQTVGYLLKARDGDRLSLEITMKQTAPKQTIKTPGAPGVEVVLQSLESTGAGTAKFDLASLVPIVETAVDLNLRMTQNGQDTKISMKMDAKMGPGKDESPGK